MNIQTRFNIGDVVWSATKCYDPHIFYGNSMEVLFYQYQLEGPFIISNIMMDALENGRVVVKYLFKEKILDLKGYPESCLYDNEEDAESACDLENQLAKIAKEDFEAKYGK